MGMLLCKPTRNTNIADEALSPMDATRVPAINTSATDMKRSDVSFENRRTQHVAHPAVANTHMCSTTSSYDIPADSIAPADSDSTAPTPS